jgi:hypothetical protein
MKARFQNIQRHKPSWQVRLMQANWDREINGPEAWVDVVCVKDDFVLDGIEMPEENFEDWKSRIEAKGYRIVSVRRFYGD